MGRLKAMPADSLVGVTENFNSFMGRLKVYLKTLSP